MEIRMEFGETHQLQRAGIAPKLWVSVLDEPAQWIEQMDRYRPVVLVACASPRWPKRCALPDRCGRG